MNQALTISEILYRIFVCFQWQFDNRSLAALARTCQTFNDPALDLMWGPCLHLPLLISALPESSIVLNSEKKIVDINPLTTEQWTRFHTYSARVREARISESAPTADAFLKFLALPPPYLGYTFPKLRRVLVEESRGLLRFPDYRFLLGPLVERVEFRLRDSPSENETLTESIIHSIPELCPNLKHLKVTWRSCTPPSWAPLAISKAVSDLDHLQTLQCPAPNSHAILHLSQLPSFEALIFDSLPPYDNSSSDTGSTAIYEFSSLRSLQITAEIVDEATVFLQHLQNLPDTLALYLYTSPQTSDVMLFLRFLDDFRNKNMDSLILVMESCYIKAIRTLHDPGPPITLQTLRPLLQHRRLHKLVIEVTSPISLTDEDIGDMSLAWPNLRHFALNVRHGWGNSAATIESIYSLVSNCPRLEYIGASIDASGLRDVPENRPASGYYNSELTQISLSDSRISDPVVLALILASIFTSKLFDVQSLRASWRGVTFGIKRHVAFWECIQEVRVMKAEGAIDENDWPPPQKVIERLRHTFRKSLGKF